MATRPDESERETCGLYSIAFCAQYQLNNFFGNGNFQMEEIAQQILRQTNDEIDPEKTYSVPELCEIVNKYNVKVKFKMDGKDDCGCQIHLNYNHVKHFNEAMHAAENHSLIVVVGSHFAQSEGRENCIEYELILGDAEALRVACAENEIDAHYLERIAMGFSSRDLPALFEAVPEAGGHDNPAMVLVKPAAGQWPPGLEELAPSVRIPRKVLEERGLHAMAAEGVAQTDQWVIKLANTWGGTARDPVLSASKWGCQRRSYKICIEVCNPGDGLMSPIKSWHGSVSISPGPTLSPGPTQSVGSLPAPALGHCDNSPPFHNQLEFSLARSVDECTRLFKRLWPQKGIGFVEGVLRRWLRKLEAVSSSTGLLQANDHQSMAILVYSGNRKDQEDMTKILRTVEQAGQVHKLMMDCKKQWKGTDSDFSQLWISCMESSVGHQYQEAAVKQFIDNCSAHQELQTALKNMPKKIIAVSLSGKLLHAGADFAYSGAARNLKSQAYHSARALASTCRSNWILLEMSMDSGLRCYYPHQVHGVHHALALHFPRRDPVVHAILSIVRKQLPPDRAIADPFVDTVAADIHNLLLARARDTRDHPTSMADWCRLWNDVRSTHHLRILRPAVHEVLKGHKIKCTPVKDPEDATREGAGEVVLYVCADNMVTLVDEDGRRQQPASMRKQLSRQGSMPMRVQETAGDNLTLEQIALAGPRVSGFAVTSKIPMLWRLTGRRSSDAATQAGAQLTCPEGSVLKISQYALILTPQTQGQPGGGLPETLHAKNPWGYVTWELEFKTSSWEKIMEACGIEANRVEAVAVPDEEQKDPVHSPPASVPASPRLRRGDVRPPEVVQQQADAELVVEEDDDSEGFCEHCERSFPPSAYPYEVRCRYCPFCNGDAEEHREARSSRERFRHGTWPGAPAVNADLRVGCGAPLTKNITSL